MGLTRTIPPSIRPVGLGDVKRHLKIDHNDEDALIRGLIVSATDLTERATGRALITATYAYTLRRFCNVMELPRPALIAVSSIQYVDSAGNTQTLASSVYTVIIDSVVGRVELAPDQSWPSTRVQSNAVTITYSAGYGPKTSDVPQTLKLAIRQLVGAAYRDREKTVSASQAENNIFQNLIASEQVVSVI